MNLPENGEYAIVLEDDPKSSSRGSYAAATIYLENGQTVNARAFFNDRTELLGNARVLAKCAFGRTSDEYAHTNYMSDLHVQANVESYENCAMPPVEGAIYEIRERAIGLLAEHGGDQAGLLQALICGYRPTMSDEGTYDSYKRCGIAHIVAVSGAHLAIVTMALGLLLRAFRAPKLLYVGASLVFILAYLLFAGMPISAIRAAAMYLLFLVSGLAGRRNATLNSLAICAIALIALEPSASVSISLFLSAASTFGIVLFATLFSGWASALPRPLQDLFAAPLAMTVASNVATLPFSVSVFGMLPLVAPIANVLVTPVFTVACVVGVAALLASLVAPAFSATLIGIASLCASPMNAISQSLSSIPNACIEAQAQTLPMLLLSALLMAALYIFRPRLTSRHAVAAIAVTIAFFAVSCIRPPASIQDRIVMLDVGQGDAFVLESNGQSLLVDTGNEPDKLRSSLEHSGVYDIEAVSISHSDSDHCDALGDIAAFYKDAKFLCASQMLECGCSKCSQLVKKARGIFGEDSVIGIGIGDSFDIGNFKVRVLWPESYTEKGGNPDSLCLLASLDSDSDGKVDWQALFTGDAESEELEKIIDAGAIGDIDVLKVGHHGSKASLNNRVLDALKPEYALVSAGKGNSYGHPTREALDVLESNGASVYRTDTQGVVEVRFSENGISVACER